MRNALTGGFATVVVATLVAPLQPAAAREAASELGGVRPIGIVVGSSCTVATEATPPGRVRAAWRGDSVRSSASKPAVTSDKCSRAQRRKVEARIRRRCGSSGGWALVDCRPDGEVRFGLAGCGEPPELIKVERS